MKELEPRVFSLWKVEATVAYKRTVMVELMKLIQDRENPTTTRLYAELKPICFNLTRVEFDCALASLKAMDVIGTYSAPRDENGDVYHVNFKRRNARVWKKYLRHIEETQPDVV